ncbi:MAG: 3-dehydroquinate dehydratase [Bacteroidetes bacterium GWE2_42_24]|nr:MAG: 3-dehydroquinate dehydratase [Bacteroidetes bacterium GWE2_42_24]OFY25408.1 MAG: 3-dehydroquinate dehydratase [Bacteroidetes bacterium GWF2_43_11]PKP24260.1 MAG: 3-dehydroquinate dehydratase [Bacteroidetes bacterium HGW-Bacteroidetes-22]
MKQIVIINGPNLNLIGTREPTIYGSEVLDDYLKELASLYPEFNLIYRQSNVEGEIINWLHEFGFSAAGIVINPGAYAHTSVAIADALRAISTPAIEVHISNVSAREVYRHTLLTGAACVGIISGLGLKGYRIAVSYFTEG